jgi:hypothetical protein
VSGYYETLFCTAFVFEEANIQFTCHSSIVGDESDSQIAEMTEAVSQMQTE